MKKRITKIASVVLSGAMVISALAGCNKKYDNSKNVTLNAPKGEIISNGGNVLGTDNYVYFINGKASDSANNKYGKPVQGALMVAERSNLENAEILAPKIVGSTDYSAGIYAYGDYIYFASPSTAKDKEGNQVEDAITFFRAKFDGSLISDIVSVNGAATEFRIAENDGKVFVVYYDAEEKQLISYNVEDKKSTVLVKNPEAFTFVDNDNLDTAVVFWTQKVEKTSYKDSDDEEDKEYEAFNEVYCYSAGGEAVKLINGSEDKVIPSNYAITDITGGYVYVAETDTAFSEAKTYALKIEDVTAKKFNSATLIEKASLISDDNIIVGLDEVYSVESGRLVKQDMTEADNASKKVVAMGDFQTLLFINGEDVYYIDSASKIRREALNDAEAEEITVTDTAVLEGWYKPEVIGDELFYANPTTEGQNYTYHVDLTGDVKESDSDDDGVNDEFYLEGQGLVGIFGAESNLPYVRAALSSLGKGALQFEYDDDGEVVVKDGKPVFVGEDVMANLRERFDALTKKEKKEFTKLEKVKKDAESQTPSNQTAYDNYTAFTNREAALKVSKAMYELFGKDAKVSDARVKEIRAMYNDLTSEQKALIVENGLYWLQQAEK